jgi:sugar phosphate isomerase/epimerase
MNRRGFIQTSAATLAAGMLGSRSSAQRSPALQSASVPADTQAQTVTKLKVDAYSRHLQWLRSADEVAEATIEMAYTGVDITVRPYPGHVDPAKVAADLPPFVQTIRKHGLDVRMITCPITDADSPNAEQILQTASSLGITHYWWGTFRYEPGQPVMKQLDALKPRVEKLAALNEKYNMKALYHTYSMPGTVGCNVWDFLYVLRNFDPAHVALHWDVGHTSLTGGNGTWAEALRAAGPYVGGVSAKEYTYELDLETPGGGPFTGTPAELNMRRFGSRPPRPNAPGGGVAGGNRQGEPGAGAGPAGGRPAEAGPAEAGPAEAGPGEGRPPEGRPAEGRPGEGRPGGAGPGERYAGPVKRGGGGQPLPWRARAVPLGEGINNLPLLATVLTEIQFSGPVEIQSEYPNGGAENAQDKITLPRIMVLGAMKRDLLTLKAGFAASGLL